jgi:hypothetical protein
VAGTLNLLGRSLDTSRRFDALKILVGLRCTGRRRLAAMVEHLVELARRTGELVGGHDELELLAPPSTVMVVFPWNPGDVHPTPKSRTELTAAEVVAYSPELAARFQLRWLAVDPDVVEHDSATGTPAPRLAEQPLRDDVDAAGAALAGIGDRVLLPAHPWELAHLRRTDPVVAALFEDGSIEDLGALGSPVTPTTSVRTVYSEAWPWQLKFSLHVRVTDSMRGRVDLRSRSRRDPRAGGAGRPHDRERPCDGARHVGARAAEGRRPRRSKYTLITTLRAGPRTRSKVITRITLR